MINKLERELVRKRTTFKKMEAKYLVNRQNEYILQTQLRLLATSGAPARMIKGLKTWTKTEQNRYSLHLMWSMKATIAGLEVEIATLSSLLQKYGPKK